MAALIRDQRAGRSLRFTEADRQWGFVTGEGAQARLNTQSEYYVQLNRQLIVTDEEITDEGIQGAVAFVLGERAQVSAADRHLGLVVVEPGRPMLVNRGHWAVGQVERRMEQQMLAAVRGRYLRMAPQRRMAEIGALRAQYITAQATARRFELLAQQVQGRERALLLRNRQQVLDSQAAIRELLTNLGDSFIPIPEEANGGHFAWERNNVEVTQLLTQYRELAQQVTPEAAPVAPAQDGDQAQQEEGYSQAANTAMIMQAVMASLSATLAEVPITIPQR